MFKVNNKDTRTTPIATPFSIANFEHVIAGWEIFKNEFIELQALHCPLLRLSEIAKNKLMLTA